MPTMTHRTTIALDGQTKRRIKSLAACWQVSQAEVVRRAVEKAETQLKAIKPDPIAVLKAYHAKGGMDRAKAEAYLAEVYEDRKHWRGEE
jgi:predicted transcriptional regulator